VAITPPAGHRFDEVMVLQKQNVVFEEREKREKGNGEQQQRNRTNWCSFR
jgi:hypothetical protein